MLIDKGSERKVKKSNIEKKSILYFVNPKICMGCMDVCMPLCVCARGGQRLISCVFIHPLIFDTGFFIEIVNLPRPVGQ